MQSSKLTESLTILNGVGPALAGKLQKLGLFRVDDLLFLLPLRYEDRTQLVRLGALRPGMRAMVSGEVLLAETVFRGRRVLLVRISDGSGQITLRFFYFSRQQQAQLRAGVNVSCYGEVRPGPLGLEMVHPEYRLLRPGQAPVSSDSLTPVYSITEGVQQGRLRNLVSQALALMKASPPAELLPRELLQKQGMPSLEEALLYLHRPPPDADLESMASGRHPCQQRLAFEELLAHYISLRDLRLMARREPAPALGDRDKLVERFLGSLPFRLTNAQKRVAKEISGDLSVPHPMMRLVQGDVGSGKTVVAAIACLYAISSGVQAAIMAPTELLAEQHWQNFNGWFARLGIRLAWLSGSQKRSERKMSLAAIADGSAQLIVGTHALFQEGVEFSNLALVVIDEQHRFGVHQRLALRNKGVSGQSQPHQLVMTATPIPRTLAMAAYADLDTSVIDELPPGRQAVQTIALPDVRRGEVVARVQRACEDGLQAYWVCPLIEESELLDYQAAEASYEMLKEALPSLAIGLIHGRMKAGAKDKVMRAFKNGEIQLLVATTVIEVGVDVPNAGLMIIENAERMGLSQLHQLRGRVGRGAAQSHCVLLYRQPLGQIAKSRLAVLRDTNDGFVVAQRDLELRGPGELLGTRQTGLPQYRVADLIRDAQLMPLVQQAAETITRSSPQQAEAIVRRWTGDAGRFGKV
ncbi:MAG: ATP-dependent DNA helicase RecG [Gammaproteobacteria bacterium]|nr:ATP-dependent DNA helicase RecG [Gammaproteobacteria bacterium]MDH4314384.1 ATP-dependent DNA helicase RecG [Gammaproteobacteria bacterium]MDH5213168.1 ATP-dependent DNA helicase RecG [Gammaproteobacteria bacterium]MDH5499782.1 ATP-dependent DNA helicase RecG [Gammaproteobacteria bacterium]